MKLNDLIISWLTQQGITSRDYQTGQPEGEADQILEWGSDLGPQPTLAQMDAAYAAQQAAQALIAQAQAALSAGVTIQSASTAALNGTYACDPQTISDIQAETVFLLVNGGQFTAGTSLQWPDASGTLHTFTTAAQFQAWATAIARYVGAIRLVINGVPGATLPTNPVQIP